METVAEQSLHRRSGDETVVEGQKRALELAVAGAPLAEILDVLARTVEEQSSSDVVASILLLDKEAGMLRHGAAPHLPEAYNAAIDGITIGDGVGSCGTAAFTAKTVVVKDIATDPLWKNFKDLAIEHGLRACWSMPFLSSAGEVLGTFALYHHEPQEPSKRDQDIVELLAHTAALLIERERASLSQRAAEKALGLEKQNELARLAAMFELAPAAIASLRGPHHVFEVANPQYLKLARKEHVVGMSVRDVFPELKDQGFYELLDGVRATGEPYVGRATRILLQRQDIDQIEEAFVDFVYQPVPDDHGNVDSILVVAFDVTELAQAKRQAEIARAQVEVSEQSLRDFIDNLPELAWTALPDGHIDYYNKRWYEYTGTTFEEMQGWGWEKVHDPELLPIVVERWKHSLETGEPFEMEFTLRGNDGVRRWFLTRVTASRDESGKILRWFGTNTDIDEMKSAQALTAAVADQSIEFQNALQEMRAKLHAAEDKLSKLTYPQAEIASTGSTNEPS